MLNHLCHIIEDSASKYPENVALIFGENQIQYNKLQEAIHRLAHGFKKLKLGKGDRIAIMLPNIPHFTISYFALLQIGVTVVPLSIYYDSQEIKHCLMDSKVRGIVFWEKFRTQVRQAVHDVKECEKLIVLGERAESGELRLTYLMEISQPLDLITQTETDDTAVIAYTMGTTETAKGIELTHDNLLSNVDSCCEFFKFGPEDNVLGVLPFYHLFGQTLVMNSFLKMGAKLILMTNFKAASVLKMIEKEKPTYFVGSPPMFQDMLINEGDQYDIRSLKFCLSIGNGLKQDTMEMYEEKFNVFILEGYGLTEASPMVSFNRANTERKAGSIGLPMPGIEMKIVDEAGIEVKPGDVGEIMVQGPNIMKGYLNQPEKNSQVLKNGWLCTGDLALLHDDGYSFIVTQKKNVIVKSGFQIYPNNIEKLLCEHPKIEDAVVFGVPISNEEEKQIHTYVLLKKGEQATPDEIIQYSNQHLPAYMCPQVVHFVSSFPIGQTGRIMRNKMKYSTIEDKSQ